MPVADAEEQLSGLRLNLRIVSVVIFNFASYLTIGLPLAVLPGYVHDVMGFSAFWAGLVISLQYFATLLSRPHAGRYADQLGPKKIVVFGLCGCFLSGLSYLLAAFGGGWPLLSLVLLCVGRVILGIGQSFAGTGSTLWGVGVVGSPHIGRVISWNGIVTYGAMAMGAPLGVLCYRYIGLHGLALAIMAVAAVAILAALPRDEVKAKKGKAMSFRAVLGRVWPYGMALALASAGFGVIATFITLFYDAKGWDGAAFALTLFSCAFVGTRLLFPNGINRLGGLNVAMICFAVEVAGLLLVGVAATPLMAKLGYPTLLCNTLAVDEEGYITRHIMRCEHSKLTTVKALQSIGYDTIASGDSYNDLEMILHSKAGFLFRGPDKIKEDYPDLPAFEEYDQLLAGIRSAL